MKYSFDEVFKTYTITNPSSVKVIEESNVLSSIITDICRAIQNIHRLIL